MQAPSFLYDYAMAFVGVPYKWGGSNPLAGFDCSGFAQELLAAVGLDFPGDQSAQQLHDLLIKSGALSVSGLGCLNFYGKSLSEIIHVTVGIDSHFCIGANGGGGKTVNLIEAIRADAFIKVRPTKYRSDFLVSLMPDYGKL